MGKARYAIYYTPDPETALWRFGAHWLGRDSAKGNVIEQLVVKGLDPQRLKEITASPRHYGFHATLKPPFRLAKGLDRETLDEALEAFVAAHPPIKVPALELAALDGFIALRPKKSSADLQGLAAACVKEFDSFRAAPSDKELEKRLQADLTKAQKALLKQWGYPYVMDEFRFHMTLTERLDDKERGAVFKVLSRLTDEILDDKPWTLDMLTLKRQKNPDAPFDVVKCYPLTKLKKARMPYTAC